MAVAIKNGSTSQTATVDTNGDLNVNLPTIDTQAGYVTIVSENGVFPDGTRYVSSPETDDDYRLRAALDSPLFNEQFPGAAINSAVWTAPVTTATLTVAGGFANLNAGLSTASGAVARLQSYNFFPVYGTFPLYVEILAQFTQSPVSNNVVEWGIGLASGTSAPTDGAFFRLNASGEFRAVVNFNGTETQSASLDFATLVGENTQLHFIISVLEDEIDFWIDDVPVAIVERPAAQAAMVAATKLPVFARLYNNAVTSVAQVIKIGLVNVTLGGAASNRDWPIAMAANGGMAYQGQTGGTMGTSANYANSANPTAAVPTNTTAALGSGLGGQFWSTATLTVNTDGNVSSYQVPAGTAALPGKTLVVRGIKISTFIQTALTGGGSVLQWSLAFGHTAVALNTTESATAKAPRRVALGVQPFASGAVFGTVGAEIWVDFSGGPIVVHPGEFIQTVYKQIGTAPSAGVYAHVITIVGYFE